MAILQTAYTAEPCEIDAGMLSASEPLLVARFPWGFLAMRIITRIFQISSQYVGMPVLQALSLRYAQERVSDGEPKRSWLDG